jgi:Rne/Rng family ribonuclease
MTKEIYISSTPHETRLAVVEDDQLAEIYYERENEYTLAGSVYKGKVTRVLPGMQSAFIDIGLERDAFLYVTDFAEDQEDGEEYVQLGNSQGNGHQAAPAQSGQHREAGNSAQREPASTPAHPPGEESEGGGRRWRGRRGRRRGRGNAQAGRNLATSVAPEQQDSSVADDERAIEFELEPIPGQTDFQSGENFEAEPVQSSHPEHVADVTPFAARQSHAQPAHQETLVLPGESLSKYRRGGAPASKTGATPAQTGSQVDASAKQPKPAPAFQPSTMIVTPLKWDGSDVLPGESISRYKNKSQHSHPQEHVAEVPFAKDNTSAEAATASPAAEAGPTGETAPIVATIPAEDLPPTQAEREVIDTQFAPAEHPLHEHPLKQHPIADSIGLTSRPALAATDEEEHPPAELSSRPESARRGEPDEVEGPAVSENFEPSETSASYRFDPAKPSAYFQNIAEPPAEEAPVLHHDEPRASQTEASSAIPAETPFDSAREQTPEPFFGESVSIAQSSHPSFESSSLAQEIEPHDDESGPEDNEAVDSDGTRSFDPGHGNLEEETIDEEETEADAAHALLDDEEYDDLVEETLDVQMDSGMLSEFVRDRHIDQRTSFQGEQDEESPSSEAPFEDMSLHDDTAEMELEDLAEAEGEEAEELETTEAPNADAAGARQGAQRGNRRGFRGQRPGGDRRRMRRSTAQTSNLPAITELLKPNQEILVQIAKEPIARKGARITSHIALPGRFLVFMPTVNHVGVSRKISSEEQRQRLKHILLSEKGSASGGFIVRTAAATASEEDLRADIRFLLTLWAEIRQRADNSKPPALIYHDLSLVERVLRDQVTDNFSAIWVDSEADYERVLRFLNRFEPSLVRRVKLYSKETPLFEQFGIQEEINKGLRSKVWLKSGGSIVINQTEALVAIDINTGKYVGKTARLEDTILKTNLDAIPEIVRQIRLRDLGGIIVIDFIDMDERKNRNKVMQALEEELKSDRAPSKVLQFNDFGLVAITRKRVKQSLERTLSVPCYVCTGTGMVKGPITVCNEIFIELRKMHRQIDRSDVLLRVHPEVVKQLKTANGRWLSEMEEMSGKTIIVKSDATLHPEQFDIH